MVAPEYIALLGVVSLLGIATAITVATDPPALAEPTFLNGDGVCCTMVDGELVPADPVALANGAGMERNEYALARVVESEAGSVDFIGQVGVAWVVRNAAARVEGRTVLDLVTRAKLGKQDGAGHGFFGRQGDSTGGYRFVASSKDPSQDARDVARAVARGEIDDPTGGAVNFDSPQSYGVQAGTEASGADEFAANRRGEGKQLVTLPGVPERELRFWRYA